MTDQQQKMGVKRPVRTLSRDLMSYHAVLFDLDGVVTKTAAVHAASWKRLFDEFLAQYAGPLASRHDRRPFDGDEDYRLYVDGKPRYDGVKSFLASRGIHLPLGQLEDGPGQQTIYGLGNKKDRYFDLALQDAGVQVYPSTLEYLRIVKAQRLPTAIVSSSHHCEEVLEAAGLSHLFDVRVDGFEIDRLGLKGKPAPDAFLEAARRLGVQPAQAIVIEDAQAGVAAARAGGFGLVIGLDRQQQAQALWEQGADVVVADLSELLPSLVSHPMKDKAT